MSNPTQSVIVVSFGDEWAGARPIGVAANMPAAHRVAQQHAAEHGYVITAQLPNEPSEFQWWPRAGTDEYFTFILLPVQS